MTSEPYPEVKRPDTKDLDDILTESDEMTNVYIQLLEQTIKSLKQEVATLTKRLWNTSGEKKIVRTKQ